MKSRLLSSLGALRERPFRLLFLGRSLSGIGDALVPVATTFAVLELGDAGDLGLVLGSYFGSRIVFVVIGGVWADRLPRQLVMIAADLLRAVVQGLIALAFFTDRIEVWHLAVSSALFGIASAFFGPASTGLVPSLVSPAHLQQANALLGMSRNGIELFGPAVSGILVATTGYGLIFAIDAASFVASLACLVWMRLPRAMAAIPKQSFLADAREGLRVIAQRRWLIVTLVCDALTNLTLAVYFVLGPVVVAEDFGGARDWGLIMTGGAAGGLIGGAVVLRWKPPRPLLAAYLIMFVMPLQVAALAFELPLALLIGGAGLVFMSIVMGNTFWQTMEQQHVPQEALSRVDAMSWMVSLVIMPVGFAAAGPLSEAFGVRATLLAAAVLAVAALLAALMSRSVRDLRRIEEAPPEMVEPAFDGPVALNASTEAAPPAEDAALR